MLKSAVNKIYDCGKCATLAVLLFIPVISTLSLQVLKVNPINFILKLLF